MIIVAFDSPAHYHLVCFLIYIYIVKKVTCFFGIMCLALFVVLCVSYALHLLLLGSCYAVYVNA